MLLFAVLMFVNELQTALITVPMMVLAPRYESKEQPAILLISQAIWLMVTSIGYQQVLHILELGLTNLRLMKNWALYGMNNYRMLRTIHVEPR